MKKDRCFTSSKSPVMGHFFLGTDYQAFAIRMCGAGNAGAARCATAAVRSCAGFLPRAPAPPPPPAGRASPRRHSDNALNHVHVPGEPNDAPLT
ncbi:hypothetical protein EVAR_7842_1 [Eumeta japonica]|uniref:Uncharacterized protein n=1 Tax=Eumeta variegata TaxID=151549 RepID=A0A4C1TV11_EUMVA|nr:hypothetical protein EVAR_7842_1 [Eumeta japonica]